MYFFFLVAHYSIVNYGGRQLLCQNEEEAPQNVKYDKQIKMGANDFRVILLCSYATIEANDPPTTKTTTTTTTTLVPGVCKKGRHF